MVRQSVTVCKMIPVLALFVCACAWWLLRKPRGDVSLPPVYPGALPFVGHAHLLLTSIDMLWSFLKDLFESSLKNGGIVKFQVGPHNVYVITDPDDCLTVSNTCLHKPYFYKFSSSWIKYGLVTLDPPVWKHKRKLFNPLFNLRILNKYIKVFNEQGQKLVEHFATRVAKGKFKPESYLMTHAFETSCQTSIGINPNILSKEQIVYKHAVEEIFQSFVKRLVSPWLHVPIIFQWSSLKKKLDKLIKKSVDVTNLIISKRKNELKTTKIVKGGNENDDNDASDDFKTFLDMLLEFNQEESLPEDEIRQDIDTMIVANYHTTAVILIFILALMGHHKEVQEKLYKELQEVIGDSNRDLNRHDLSKLEYMEAVIKESLRLYTPVPAIARKADTEVKLKNYTIPAGGSYLLSFYGIHRHPIWGADAEQFRPERWLEPDGVPDNPNVFSAFSLGSRNCIGKTYAMMLIKTTLAHLFRQYRIIADITNMVFTFDTFIKPTAGHELEVELRN